MKQIICLCLCLASASLALAQNVERSTLIINESYPSQHLDWVYDSNLKLGHFESCRGEICLTRGQPFSLQDLPRIYAYFEKEAIRLANGRQLRSPLTKRQRLIAHYTTVGVAAASAIPIYFLLSQRFALEPTQRTPVSLGIVAAGTAAIVLVNGYFDSKYKKTGQALATVIGQLQSDEVANKSFTIENTGYQLLIENLHLAIQSLDH